MKRPATPRTRLALSGLLAALVFLAAAAEEYRVRAWLRPDGKVQAGQTLELVIQIEGSTAPQLRPPMLEGLTNLERVGGPNTSNRFSWSNGRASASAQIVYTLLAREAGRASVPSLSIELDGRLYRTEALEVQVDPRGSTTPGPPAAKPEAAEQADVFLQAEVEPAEVWVGQPALLTLTLFTAERISNPLWRSRPSFASFWVEELEYDDEPYRTERDGRRYTAYTIERKLLIPPSPGSFSIEPYVAQMQVRRLSGDVFDLFSLGRTRSIVRQSNRLGLRARPLPVQDRPPTFSGAVGRFDIDVTLDREQVEVHDAVVLRASVEGEGSLRAAAAPVFDAPVDVKIFDPKVTQSSRTQGGRVTSSKTWEWVLVPLKSGSLSLPELSFAYFDPQAAAYRVARRDLPELRVERGRQDLEPSPPGRAIEVQRRDLAFIKPLSGELRVRSPRAHERPWFRFSLLLPGLLVPLIVLYGRRRARLREDFALLRARKARSRSRKSLRLVRREIATGDGARFHEDLARALVEYVADRFNRSAAGLTYDLADELLAAEGVNAELRRRYRACLESCDFARFVPAASRLERREELLQEAGRIIEQLERAW